MSSPHYITISGSYRKFPTQVAADIEHFRDLGVTVLSPQSTTILTAVDGFVSLEGDLVPNLNHLSQNNIRQAIRLIEDSHLNAITRSDALWLTIPEGYCGTSTAFEMGCALMHGIPIFYNQQYTPLITEPIIQKHAMPATIERLVWTFSHSKNHRKNAKVQ